ncbi:hypothetical protein ACSFA7_03580 [Variovorax sp. LT1R20]|uniref:hypothetical protein n=1 Tax=Variovorax sp. LT1R20 TaxID=3443729 RepID=UPI003F46E43C
MPMQEDIAPRFVLLQMRTAPAAASRIDADVRAFCAAHATTLALHRAASSLDGSQAYVYLKSHGSQALDGDAMAATFQAQCDWASELRASPLEPMLGIEGASAGERPRFHYVVETDPETGWLDEISRWYDTEHMPGLAAVRGCVRAMRFLNRGAGPLSLACYDLQREDVLGSPPWLAVRATAWSGIARPHFTNTKRTMFRVIAEAP